jgi:hypothetical protein
MTHGTLSEWYARRTLEIGVGIIGEVWLARSSELERDAAVKVLH